MLPTQPDTFINVLLNVKTEWLENTHGDTNLLNESQFELSKRTKRNLIASSMRRFA